MPGFDPELDLPPEQPNGYKHWRNMIICLTLCSPVLLVGFVLCLTVVLIPVGLLIMVLGALPAIRMEQKYEEKLQAWKDRDHPLYDDDDLDHPRPWDE